MEAKKFTPTGELPRVKYPVGADIARAMEIVSALFNTFEKQYPNYKEYKDIDVWARGSSGAIFGAFFVSMMYNDDYKFRARVQHVKKPGEESHHAYCTFSQDHFNIIIDDFISSGETIRAIITASRTENPMYDLLLVSSFFSYSIHDIAISVKHIMCEDIDDRYFKDDYMIQTD